MSQLLKNTYMQRDTPKPFELVLGQSHKALAIIYQAGWFNKDGEKLGFGDLSGKDFNTIANGLEYDELFFVLDSKSADIGQCNEKNKTSLTVDYPGTEYVTKNASYVVSPKQCYIVDRSENISGPINKGGAVFKVIKESELQQLLLQTTSASDR